MFPDRDHVWWIVPAGQQVRHAVTDPPGSRPAGEEVRAMCSATVKVPYDTWPASRPPATREITNRCAECESAVAQHQRDTGDLVISTWDS